MKKFNRVGAVQALVFFFLFFFFFSLVLGGFAVYLKFPTDLLKPIAGSLFLIGGLATITALEFLFWPSRRGVMRAIVSPLVILMLFLVVLGSTLITSIIIHPIFGLFILILGFLGWRHFVILFLRNRGWSDYVPFNFSEMIYGKQLSDRLKFLDKVGRSTKESKKL